MTLDAPMERAKTLRWGGAVVPPPSGAAFDKIGIEIRTFLPAVAYAPHPRTGAYAVADLSGPGIIDYAEWIDAVLQLYVQCRGEIWQLIDCHGLSYVLAPAVEVIGLSRDRTMTQNDDRVYAYYLSPHLYLRETEKGWLYREPAPGEYAKWQSIDAYPTRGPFATVDDALRDAIETLGIPRPEWLEELAQFDAHTEIGRAAARLHRSLSGTSKR